MNNQEEQELETTSIIGLIKQREALERLYENEDFQLVIMDKYIKGKSLEGVALLADSRIKSSGARPDVMEELVSVSNLKQHFAMIEDLGRAAEADLEEFDNGQED